MKKQTTVTSIFLATLLLGAGTVFAQATVQNSVGIETSGGGLGKGINSMVRSILGEGEGQAEKKSAPAPEPSLRMQMNAVSDQAMPVSPPQASTMMMKAEFSEQAVSPMTQAELNAYIRELLLQDSNIQSIDSSDTHVRITYTVPSKVFRVVKVTLRVTASAAVSGETSVTYPWYAFGATAALNDLRADLKSNVEPGIPTESFTTDDQRTLIDALHVSLAAKLGSSTGGDR